MKYVCIKDIELLNQFNVFEKFESGNSYTYYYDNVVKPYNHMLRSSREDGFYWCIFPKNRY